MARIPGPAPSDDAALSGLLLSDVDIGTFEPGTTEYSAMVAHAVSATTVAATPAHAGASYVITGPAGSTADAEREVALSVGGNRIEVEVTAADGVATRTYVVTVTRRAAPPRPPPPPPSGGGVSANRAPAIAEALAARTVAAGATLAVDLSAAFDDPDGDGLSYAASSSDPSVATAATEGARLTVRGVAGGAARITVTARDPDGGSASQTFAVAVTVTAVGTAAADGLGMKVWLFASASDPLRQGFARVLNHSDQAGTATVTATDDAGNANAPLTLELCARCATPFNSDDLELGNAAKGLGRGTGPGEGGWRLEVASDTLDVEALGYLRTAEGFVTAMVATAPADADGTRRVATFNPASNVDQVSLLRLVNPTDGDAEATVTGVDDAGRSPGEPVALTVPAGTACTVDARALESGRGLACGSPQAGLGDGEGKWRLAVASEPPLVALSLLSSPTGHLTNLSGTAAPDADGRYHVHQFPSASDPLGRQGFVRVRNRSDAAGTVTIAARDDTDVEYGTLTLALDAGETAPFNSDDLELGNRSKGLTGSTGSGTGAWRLALSSDDIAFEVNAYIRTSEGFLTAMNASAPAADRVHRIAIFNPGSNTEQVSVLRLVNPGARGVRAAVTGTDDAGVRPGTTVRVVVPAGDAVELTAAELESGEHDAITDGALGDGTGKWRLRVESDRNQDPIIAMSLLSSPTGHLTNLSRADPDRGYGRTPARLLPPPAEVTLEQVAGSVRGRWSAVEGARYRVELIRDGVRDDDRSLSRTTRMSFRWSSLLAGTYTMRACSVNEDHECGGWSAVSNAVLVD